MKYFSFGLILGFAAFLFAHAAIAEDWSLDPERSTISYVSIKNGAVAEHNQFTQLSGHVSEAGQARIDISLASVETQIPIRNERVRKFLFDVANFPLATLSADLTALDGFDDSEIGNSMAVSASITLAANGREIPYDAQFMVTVLSDGTVSVVTTRPVLVHAADLGYGPGLDKLREIAGLDSILPIVPVTAELVFTHD